MSPWGTYDVAVVGGGIMGCTTALHLARAGMRVVLLERRGLCTAASGVNSGTLAIQIKKPALIPYSVRAAELWKRAPEWLGADLGYHALGGLIVAFTDDEARALETLTRARKAAGAPIEIMGLDRARRIEPALGDEIILASYCPLDGYAHSYLIGRVCRAALFEAGVDVREQSAVDAIATPGRAFEVRTGSGALSAHRIVLATNGWLETMVTWFDRFLPPFITRANQAVVTERTRPLLRTVLSVVNGRLTLKQTRNGTVLIGGGWQGIGDLARGGVGVIRENMIGNIRLARYIIPGLAEARVMRAWVGIDSRLPDFLPLVGPLTGVEDAYVISSFGAGFTHGPIFGLMLAQAILGREPELPLFDPARVVRDRPYPSSSAASSEIADPVQ